MSGMKGSSVTQFYCDNKCAVHFKNTNSAWPSGLSPSGPLTDLGGVHSKQMFLCRFVFAGVSADVLTHHQHKVLLAASKCHQVLVGVAHQQFLSTRHKNKL